MVAVHWRKTGECIPVQTQWSRPGALFEMIIVGLNVSVALVRHQYAAAGFCMDLLICKTNASRSSSDNGGESRLQPLLLPTHFFHQSSERGVQFKCLTSSFERYLSMLRSFSHVWDVSV